MKKEKLVKLQMIYDLAQEHPEYSKTRLRECVGLNNCHGGLGLFIDNARGNMSFDECLNSYHSKEAEYSRKHRKVKKFNLESISDSELKNELIRRGWKVPELTRSRTIVERL